MIKSPKLLKALLVIFIALILFPGCENRSARSLLDKVENMLEENPEEALALLQSLDTTTLNSRRLKADYSLFHTMALDKNWIDIPNEDMVMPAVLYYSGHRPLDKRGKAFYYLGVAQNAQDKHDDAYVSFLRAKESLDSLDGIHFKSLVCQALAVVLDQTRYYNFDEVIALTDLSYKYSLMEGDTLGANASLYCKATELWDAGHETEADALYRELIERHPVHQNLRADLYADYATSCAVFQKDYAKAVEFYEKSLEEGGALKDQTAWGGYAYSLLRVGKKKESEDIFRQLENSDSGDQLSFKKWKSMACEYLGDYKEAYKWQGLAADIQFKNVQLALKQSAIKAKSDFMEMEKESARRKVSAQKRAISFLAAALLLITSGLIIFFWRRNIRQTRERESLLDLQGVMEKELNRKEKERESVRKRYIDMCRKYFGQTGRLNELLTSTKETDSHIYKQLKSCVVTLDKDEESQRMFELMLNESFDNVMINFRESFPGKKPRFYKLASFLFAGFDAATICVIIPSYSKHNVYVEKSRMKAMIEQSDSQHKSQFLELMS